MAGLAEVLNQSSLENSSLESRVDLSQTDTFQPTLSSLEAWHGEILPASEAPTDGSFVAIEEFVQNRIPALLGVIRHMKAHPDEPVQPKVLHGLVTSNRGTLSGSFAFAEAIRQFSATPFTTELKAQGNTHQRRFFYIPSQAVAVDRSILDASPYFPIPVRMGRSQDLNHDSDPKVANPTVENCLKQLSLSQLDERTLRNLFDLREPASDEDKLAISGLCAQIDPELFYPEKGESNKSAKAICKRCEVKDICLKQALARGDGFGVWGGLGARQRQKISAMIETNKPANLINSTIAKFWRLSIAEVFSEEELPELSQAV